MRPLSWPGKSQEMLGWLGYAPGTSGLPGGMRNLVMDSAGQSRPRMPQAEAGLTTLVTGIVR